MHFYLLSILLEAMGALAHLSVHFTKGRIVLKRDGNSDLELNDDLCKSEMEASIDKRALTDPLPIDRESAATPQ